MIFWRIKSKSVFVCVFWKLARLARANLFWTEPRKQNGRAGLTTADIQVHSRIFRLWKNFEYNFAQKLTKGKNFVYLIDLWPSTKGQVCDLWALEALEMVRNSNILFGLVRTTPRFSIPTFPFYKVQNYLIFDDPCLRGLDKVW